MNAIKPAWEMAVQRLDQLLSQGVLSRSIYEASSVKFFESPLGQVAIEIPRHTRPKLAAKFWFSFEPALPTDFKVKLKDVGEGRNDKLNTTPGSRLGVHFPVWTILIGDKEEDRQALIEEVVAAIVGASDKSLDRSNGSQNDGRATITSGTMAELREPEVEDNQEADISSDIDALIGDKTLDETTRKQLIDARVGQGRFRKDVIAVWGNGEQCAVTGISVRDVLVASHIRPWKSCATHDERLAGTNGILLAAHLDKLFDRFLISFDETGTIMISQRLTTQHRDELKTAGIDMKMKLDFSRLDTANDADIKKMLREHHAELTRRDLQAG